MKIASYYPKLKNSSQTKLPPKNPNFGNKEDDYRDDKKELLITAELALATTIAGVAYLCKSPKSATKEIQKVSTTSIYDVPNKYSDILEWVNNDLKFYKRNLVTNIKVCNKNETKEILKIDNDTLLINEEILNNIDSIIANKIKNIKENNILNINFNFFAGKETSHVPGNTRVLVHEINLFEAGELKTTLEKIKLALRLIQVGQAANLLTKEPFKYLEQIINGPLKNSVKTKGLLNNIEEIKQLPNKKQFKLLQEYINKGDCAWAQDHPIKSILKDAEINLKLYFHPNKKNSLPLENKNVSTPKIKEVTTKKNITHKNLQQQKNNTIINSALKELNTTDTTCIYMADPYLFKMSNGKIINSLKQCLEEVKDKEIRIITINLSKRAQKALIKNNGIFNNKIVIKNLIPKGKQLPFHDRWLATSENEYAMTNSLNNCSFDISVLKSKDRFYKESERLWNATEQQLNCIIEEIILLQ